MPYIDDFALDDRDFLIIYLIGLKDSHDRTVTDILHLNKMVRYYQKLMKTNEIEFHHFNLGDVSDEIRDQIEALEENGLIEIKDYMINLTNEGSVACKEVKEELTEKEKKILQYVKLRLNDLVWEELLLFMYLTVPESTKNSKVFRGLMRNKERILSKMYKKGKISVDELAEWLGISKKEALKKFGYPLAL